MSKQGGVSKVPDDFQTPDFVLNHGMLDKITPRKELKMTLSNLVRLLGGHLESRPAHPASNGKQASVYQS